MLAEARAYRHDLQPPVSTRRDGVGVPSGMHALSWMERASCRDTDPELFFPDPEGSVGQIARAKAVCAGCPVVSECRAHGERVEANLARSEWYSVLGGESPSERLARRPA